MRRLPAPRSTGVCTWRRSRGRGGRIFGRSRNCGQWFAGTARPNLGTEPVWDESTRGKGAAPTEETGSRYAVRKIAASRPPERAGLNVAQQDQSQARFRKTVAPHFARLVMTACPG